MYFFTNRGSKMSFLYHKLFVLYMKYSLKTTQIQHISLIANIFPDISQINQPKNCYLNNFKNFNFQSIFFLPPQPDRHALHSTTTSRPQINLKNMRDK